MVIGVSRECVSRWENGRFAVGATVIRLCDCWDVARPEQRKQLYSRWGVKRPK